MFGFFKKNFFRILHYQEILNNWVAQNVSELERSKKKNNEEAALVANATEPNGMAREKGKRNSHHQ